MKLTVQKWGNSAAIRLPAQLINQLNISLGDQLMVNIHPEGALLKPARKAYTLSELVAQCDRNAPPPADMAVWNQEDRQGREIW